MTEYRVLGNLKIDGDRFAPGDLVDADRFSQAQIGELIAVGAIEPYASTRDRHVSEVPSDNGQGTAFDKHLARLHEHFEGADSQLDQARNPENFTAEDKPRTTVLERILGVDNVSADYRDRLWLELLGQ